MEQQTLKQFDQMWSISAMHRRTGYTTMMLKTAIQNPNCIIIARDNQTKDWLQKRYYELQEEIYNPKGWVKKMKVKMLIRIGFIPSPSYSPRFLTLESKTNGLKGTVFFDNSCFF